MVLFLFLDDISETLKIGSLIPVALQWELMTSFGLEFAREQSEDKWIISGNDTSEKLITWCQTVHGQKLME